jgi:phosphoenolpyruvate carboxykinase (GTP)
MANLDFLSTSIGRYIKNHLDFAKDIKSPPKIFGVNYFLKDDEGNYLTGRQDKRVWLKWMELRIHRNVEAIESPIGFIPKYEDLKKLFSQVLNKVYTGEDYKKQFKLRVAQNIEKAERIAQIYKTKVLDTPEVLFKVLKEQKERLEGAKQREVSA